VAPAGAHERVGGPGPLRVGRLSPIEVGEFLRIYAVRAPRIMWFLGAGASASAGVPTAWEMTWDFKRRLYCSAQGVPPASIGDLHDSAVQARLQQHLDELGRFPALGAEDEYATYFEAAFADEADRRQYIEECIRSATLGAGYLALAAQFRASHARIVWTTNFDHLIEDAAIRAFRTTARLAVSTIQNSDVARDALIEERWPLLIKLHGDFHSRRLKNTATELALELRPITLGNFVPRAI
jgi:hypothetical protein